MTASEEKEIVRSCIVMQELGFPLHKELVSQVIRDFLADRERPSVFSKGVPGSAWWSGFFRRNPELVQRKPEHLPRSRAQAAKPEVKRKKDNYAELISLFLLLLL